MVLKFCILPPIPYHHISTTPKPALSLWHCSRHRATTRRIQRINPGGGRVSRCQAYCCPPQEVVLSTLWRFVFHKNYFKIFFFFNQYLRFPKLHLKDTTFLSEVKQAYVKELETQEAVLDLFSGRTWLLRHGSTQDWGTIFNTIL